MDIEVRILKNPPTKFLFNLFALKFIFAYVILVVVIERSLKLIMNQEVLCILRAFE